jgi:hypothetical protein
MAAVLTKTTRPKRGITALANVMRMVGPVRVIKMTGRKEAPGPRMEG